MTKTREQLVIRALNNLQIESRQASVIQRVDSFVESLMDDLGKRGLFSWGDEDELPEAEFEHLGGLLAIAAAANFGKKAMFTENDRVLLESRLRLLNGAVYSGQTLKTTYY